MARLGRRLPLPLRYAVRDAARHRTRTVPAVAAVAATVAGVVALGIAVSSDEAENAGRYAPTISMGTGVVTLSDQAAGRADAARAAVTTAIPDADVTVLRGVRESVRRRERCVLVVPGPPAGRDAGAELRLDAGLVGAGQRRRPGGGGGRRPGG